jgi:hypothetical protein
VSTVGIAAAVEMLRQHIAEARGILDDIAPVATWLERAVTLPVPCPGCGQLPLHCDLPIETPGACLDHDADEPCPRCHGTGWHPAPPPIQRSMVRCAACDAREREREREERRPTDQRPTHTAAQPSTDRA